MDLLRKYMMSTAMLRSPDEPAAPEPDTNVLDTPTPEATAVEPQEPEVPAEPEPAPTKEDGRKNPWYLKRISDEAEARRAAEDRERAAIQRAADAEALAARLQAGETPPTTPRATPAAGEDFQTAVQKEAQRLRLYDDTVAVKSAGLDKFADFNDTLRVLNAIGATNDDFVMDVLAVDKANAHTIFDKLAKDPERAAALVTMDSRRRTAELTRMSMTAAAETKPGEPKSATPPTKQVSRAPAPPPPVQPSASKIVDGYSDEASDAEFTAQFNERMKARAGRR